MVSKNVLNFQSFPNRMDAQFAYYRRNNKIDSSKTLSGIPRHTLLGPKRKHHLNNNKCEEGKPGSFSCNICGKVLGHSVSMRRHRREVHGLHKRLGKGGKEFLEEGSVTDHDPKVHECLLCGMSYSHRRSLYNHQRVVHKVFKDYKVRLKVFKDYKGKGGAEIENEKLVENTTSLKIPNPVKKKKMFDCRSCNLSFRSYSSFWAHRKIHAAVTQTKRAKLKERGNQSTSVTMTKKIHSTKNQKIHVTKNCNITKKQRLECDICGRMLGNAGSLVRHRKVHTQDKPYKSETCGVTFAERFNLKHHLSTHTGT